MTYFVRFHKLEISMSISSTPTQILIQTMNNLKVIIINAILPSLISMLHGSHFFRVECFVLLCAACFLSHLTPYFFGDFRQTDRRMPITCGWHLTYVSTLSSPLCNARWTTFYRRYQRSTAARWLDSSHYKKSPQTAVSSTEICLVSMLSKL